VLRSIISSHWRVILLALLLLFLVIPKLSYSAGAGPYGLDASYYYQIARNVAEGRGLVTNVSLYHAGIVDLPAPTSMSPLWPLFLGFAGRVMGLIAAVDFVPRALYFIALILLYVLANRLSQRTWGQTRLAASPWSPDIGHLFVLIFGVNILFFSSTTDPYTEGLAFALAFGALLLLDRTSGTRPLLWVTLSGVCSALAFLTRTQMIALMAGIGLALAIAAIKGSRVHRFATVLYAMIVGGTYLWWRAAFLLGTAQYRDPHVRGSYSNWVASESWIDYLLARVEGVLVGFDVGSPYSYVALFGPAALLVPIAAVVALWRWAPRSRRSMTLPEPESLLLLATVLSGLAFFGSLTLFQGTFFRPWLFSWRHGLPYVFLMLPAIGYLLFTSRRWARVACLVVILLSIGLGVVRVQGLVTAPRPKGPTTAESAMLSWLAARHDDPPTLLTTHAQTLSVLTDARIHWTLCTEPPEQTRLMLARLPIDYVVVYGWEQGCPFSASTELGDLLRVSEKFGEGPRAIFLLERRDLPSE
jgi:hypothetical protein